MSQFTLGSLVRAISAGEIGKKVAAEIRSLERQVNKLLADFNRSEISAAALFELENQLELLVRQFCLRIVQWILETIEPKLREMPQAIEHKGKSFRQLRDKSTRKDILTRFGKVEITRSRYRNGRQGETIFPLELFLGIERGFTPAAADMAGKQFAATGSSQGRTIEAIRERTGVTIGAEKLRGLVEKLSSSLEPYREETQVERVVEMLAKARESGGKPVLSVSRDAVSLGIAPWGYFEMASVACVSVMANGKRLGTVYLGRAPEENQRALSNQLTSLLKAVLRRCDDALPQVVYVTDAGKIETAYWENELKRFSVDGRRIPITRVVDYYHAAERFTVIADALKFDGQQQRSKWLKHVRVLLREPNGHGRVLRSIATMTKRLGMKSSKADDAAKAEQYLRRYKPFMNYNQLKSRGFPIGSGVVESACKQIVSERMKLAGMRWSREGGQKAMTLRCLLLSKIWGAVYDKWLHSKPTVSDFTVLQTV
jgi:hypothetical protein